MCCLSAVSAADDIASDDGLSIDQNTDVQSVTVDEEVGVSDTETVSAQNEASNNDKLTIDGATAADTRTPYQKFCDDMEDNEGTINLAGDIKINSVFVIKEDYVIDGHGHSIDAQGKTQIFDIRPGYTLTLKNLILKNGKASEGGAIICRSGNLKIDHCTFINNKATSYGGAILMRNGHLTISDSVFEKNTIETSGSKGYGGALWVFGSVTKITNSQFKSNAVIAKSLKSHSKATKYKFNGGAITFSEKCTIELTGCSFTGNQASNHGGAIFVFKSKSLTIKKCVFNKNIAKYEDGGAISFAGQKLVITGSTFKNNRAYEDGGAFDSYSLTSKKIKVTVKDTTFESNTAYKGGGAIWMGVKTVYKIENSNFNKNKASLGGALVAEAGSAQIIKCTFTGNKAAKVTSWTVKTKSGAKLNHCGGAIFNEKDNVKLTKCTIKNNKATYGGGIFIKTGKMTLTNNVITGNKASKYGTQLFADSSIKIGNKNKWGPKKLSTKKAIKVKNMFGGKARA